MVVSEIMTENPAFVEVGQALDTALEALDNLQIRHLPVVDEGRLVGILSDRDLAAYRHRGLDGDQLPTIAALMSADVLSVDPESDVSEAIELMLDAKCGAIPVVEPDTDRLVGIVSYVDVLSSHVQLLDD